MDGTEISVGKFAGTKCFGEGLAGCGTFCARPGVEMLPAGTTWR
jgi:hypothetical protein